MKITPSEAIQRIDRGMRKTKGNGQPIELVDVRGEELYIVKQGKQGLLLPSDSDLVPVLAEYDIVGKTMPPSLKAWLEEYQREIEWFQTAEHSETTIRKAAAVVEERVSVPMLIDAVWSQKSPYYNHLVIGGQQCLVGCNALSMAMALYYFGKQGFYRGCKKTPEYKSGSTLIPSLSPIPEFDYKNLTPKKPTTQAGIEAVATLCEYCGKAIKSVYGTSVTNGNIAVVAGVLKDSFRMGNAITTIYASSGAEAFEEKVYKQIAKKRPVLMAGWSSAGGHTFICDGYDAAKDMYHFNWGWGGSYNGWFAMSALNPHKYTFNSNKKAIIGIQPNYIQGDVDGDGKVTVTDAMKVVDNILNDKYDDTADLNYDGKNTVTDAMLIVDKTLKE